MKCDRCGRDEDDDKGHTSWDCPVKPQRVPCDEACGALEEPITLGDYKAALEHWRKHGYLSGCSHGC